LFINRKIERKELCLYFATNEWKQQFIKMGNYGKVLSVVPDKNARKHVRRENLRKEPKQNNQVFHDSAT
jgi:hypothetical protein